MADSFSNGEEKVKIKARLANQAKAREKEKVLIPSKRIGAKELGKRTSGAPTLG